jgi:hypothetical protein
LIRQQPDGVQPSPCPPDQQRKSHTEPDSQIEGQEIIPFLGFFLNVCCHPPSPLCVPSLLFNQRIFSHRITPIGLMPGTCAGASNTPHWFLIRVFSYLGFLVT